MLRQPVDGPPAGGHGSPAQPRTRPRVTFTTHRPTSGTVSTTLPTSTVSTSSSTVSTTLPTSTVSTSGTASSSAAAAGAISKTSHLVATTTGSSHSRRHHTDVILASSALPPSSSHKVTDHSASLSTPGLYDMANCGCCQVRIHTHTHTHQFNGPCPGLPRWASTRNVKPIWILLELETVSGSGISWAICKSAPRSRQITTLASHYSVFL